MADLFLVCKLKRNGGLLSCLKSMYDGRLELEFKRKNYTAGKYAQTDDRNRRLGERIKTRPYKSCSTNSQSQRAFRQSQQATRHENQNTSIQIMQLEQSITTGVLAIAMAQESKHDHTSYAAQTADHNRRLGDYNQRIDKRRQRYEVIGLRS